MGEVATLVLKIIARSVVIFAIVFAIIVLLNITFSAFVVGLNLPVLSDIFGLVQLYLPFNLNVVLLWLTTASVAYIGYRLAVLAFSLVDDFVSD